MIFTPIKEIESIAIILIIHFKAIEMLQLFLFYWKDNQFIMNK